MNDNQLKLLAFVIDQHGSQKRKYNHEPYWFHLFRVGRMANEYLAFLGFEIGLCHDLIEDTGLSLADLTKKLEEIGYNKESTDTIVETVFHLTDKYTPEAYPTLNRRERKNLEAQRLWNIPSRAQTVKYCDLIDNLGTIVQYDPKFAEVYIQEKLYILGGMNEGHHTLYKRALELSSPIAI